MKKNGLYDPSYEHDNCGVGFVANIDGTPSHQIVKEGLTVLENLVHRGAVGSDVNSGDGAGILTQIPWEFFTSRAEASGFSIPEPSESGVGMLFFPTDEEKRTKAIELVEEIAEAKGARVLGWRELPVNPDCLGPTARSSMPFMGQLFLQIPGVTGDELERRLFIIRRVLEKSAAAEGFSREEFYIPS